MFARSVSINLKANSTKEFTQTMENQVIPLLRKQKGFRDEITLVAPGPGGLKAIGISIWDLRENAEAYNQGAYTEVQKALAKVVEGTPEVQTYEVSNSTFHKNVAHAGA
jgi:hypothetical protein